MPDGGFDLEGMLGQAAQGKLAPPSVSTPMPAAPSAAQSAPIMPARPTGVDQDAAQQTNLSPADYAKFMAGAKPGVAPAPAAPSSPPTEPPPGAQSFDLEAMLGQAAKGDYKAPPTPPPAPDEVGGIGKNLAAGLAEGGINALAAPVNLANAAINLPIRGANALLGTSIPQFSTDVGGEASRALAHAMGGFSPTEVPTNGPIEGMARAA